jgi:3-mercaptopyruvate sulfurtransferase SseA
MAVNPADGSSKGADELRAICQATHHIRLDREVICHGCGAGSGHTRFVFACILGCSSVKTYAGSRAERGHLLESRSRSDEEVSRVT